MTRKTPRTRRNGSPDDDATQWIAPLITGPADGATYTFTGASGLGVMGADTEPIARLRTLPPYDDADIPEPVIRPRPAPPVASSSAYRKCPRCQENNHCEGATVNCDCPCTGAAPPPRRTSGPADWAPIAEDTARGWHHMFTIRCEHPAGTSGGQSIPCDQEWRDDSAGSFPGLYRSAWDAGWRLDAWWRWHCPGHAEHSGQYRAFYPLTHWHPDAPAHREAGDEDGAHRLRAAAEHGVFRGVLEQARQGRHRRPVTA